MEEGENEEDLSALLSPWQSGSGLLRDTKNSLDRVDQSRSSLQPPFFSLIYEKQQHYDVKLPPLNDEITKTDDDGLISGINSTRSRVSSKHQDFPRKVHSTEFVHNQPQNLANYFAQFNGDNFITITKKIEKEKPLVYDCFGEFEIVFPFSMRSDVKRRLQILQNQLKHTKKRYKRSSDQDNNHQLMQMYYPSEKNLQNSQNNEKNNNLNKNNTNNTINNNNINNQLGVLSDKDKAGFKLIRSFPERKMFPNMSTPFKVQLDEKSILFDSKFENANLRRAYRAGEQEYDLVLDFDVGTDHFTQWFYFRTANLKKGTKVKFNIVNLYKDRSLFENGMRPVVFSQRDYEKKNIGWHRDGINVTYLRNDFKRVNFTNIPKTESGGSSLNWNTSNNNNNNSQSGNIYMNKKKNSMKNYQFCNTNSNSSILSSNNLNMNQNLNNNITNNPTFYFTLSFTYIYQNDEDIVYFATSVPYTYPFLHHYLTQLQAHSTSNKFSHVDTLTTTQIGNRVFCMTITDEINDQYHPSHNSKKEIVISGRVHPGESNSSWILKGMMDFILSEHEIARNLRKKFIFRIIPMLNPDGVRYGNYRCCILGNDLNRRWRNASELLHTPIYAMKELVKRLQTCEEGEDNKKIYNNPPCLPYSEGREVEMFIDVHGHSKQLSAFIYGCQFKQEEQKVSSPKEQININNTSDLKNKNNNLKQLAFLYGLRKSFFDYEQSLFGIQKDKQGTARMVGFNELGIVKSFTLECSLYGYKNKNEGQIVNNSEFNNINNLNSSNKVIEMGPDEFEEVGRELLISLEINSQENIQNLIQQVMSQVDQLPQIMAELKKILRERECNGVLRPPGFLKSGFTFNPAVDYHVLDGDHDRWDQEEKIKKKEEEQEQENEDNENNIFFKRQSYASHNKQIKQDGLYQGHLINDDQFKSVGDTQIPRQKQHLVDYLQRASKISEQFLEYQLIQASKQNSSNNYNSFPIRHRANNISDKIQHNSDSKQGQFINTIIMPISQDSLISSPKNTPKNINFSARKTLDTSIVVFQSAGMDSMSYIDKKITSVNTPRLRINSNNGRDVQSSLNQNNIKQTCSAKILDGFLIQQNQEFNGLSQNHQPFQSPLVWRQPSLKVNRKQQGIKQNQLVHLSRQASCFKQQQQQQQNNQEGNKNSNNNNNNSKSDSDVLLSQAAVASLISGRYSLKFQSKKTIQILRENSEKEDKNYKQQYKNNSSSSSSRFNLNNITIGIGNQMNEDIIPSITDRIKKEKKGNQEMFYLKESKDVEYLLPKMNKFQEKNTIS